MSQTEQSNNQSQTEQLINITPPAIKEIKRLMAEEGDDNLYLRLGVEAGGCSGMSYAMGFDTRATDSDRVFEFDGVKAVVDARSLLYMSGTTLDYAGGLMGGGFKFLNPKARRSCGCGTSFSV